MSDRERQKVRELCLRYGVERLDLFGSATERHFDPERSDLDFVVLFRDRDEQGLFDRYFGLKEDLGRLFDREVDVLMDGAIKNPYFKRNVNESRTPLYAA